MNNEAIEVAPSEKSNHVLGPKGELWKVPSDWELQPPGDAALSRRLKKDGPSWTVKEKKGRKTFSHGIWAPASKLNELKKQLEKERSNPSYDKKLEAGRKTRAAKQESYIQDFHQAVCAFLNFHANFKKLEVELAQVITEHATPVGSGTVARTQRIPIEKRAESATIAWMRHCTTAYETMKIPRIKNARKEVRRELAKQSKIILEGYRAGKIDFKTTCPLQKAIKTR